MLVSELLEATAPYVKKMIDPALMTFQEYLSFINPRDKSHPMDSYDWDMEQMNRSWSKKKEELPNLINRILVDGERFEIRMGREDRSLGRYVKTNQDGDIIRDEKGMALYMSPEEVQDMLGEERRWEYTIAMFNEAGQKVATAQDEWGAMLYVVAREYRGRGLGQIISKIARTLEPAKPSGGLTSYGRMNVEKLHSQWVAEYLQSGTYSMLIRTGQITKERVKDIVDSARYARTTGEKGKVSVIVHGSRYPAARAKDIKAGDYIPSGDGKSTNLVLDVQPEGSTRVKITMKHIPSKLHYPNRTFSPHEMVYDKNYLLPYVTQEEDPVVPNPYRSLIQNEDS